MDQEVKDMIRELGEEVEALGLILQKGSNSLTYEELSQIRDDLFVSVRILVTLQQLSRAKWINSHFSQN